MRRQRDLARAHRITLLLVAMFGVSACVKLFAPQVYSEPFPAMGLPLGFVTVVGVVELVGAAFLLVRRFAALSAAALALLMAIALALTASNGRWGEALLTLVTLLLSVECTRLRWPDLDPLPRGRA